jgi:uncharacterized protein (TIGR03435 family)
VTRPNKLFGQFFERLLCFQQRRVSSDRTSCSVPISLSHFPRPARGFRGRIERRNMPCMKSFALCACLSSFGLTFAQPAPDGAGAGPRFEVASIKPSDPNPASPLFIGMSADGAMVKYTNITLRDCIRGAYRARDFQIVGPDWMTKARYEISARLPAGASTEQIPEMLRALLVERFKLEIRHEMKEQNVYALLVGNGGPKLKPAERKTDANSPKALGPDGKPRDPMMYGRAPGGLTIRAPYASLESLVGLVSRFTDRPVVDMTGIEGQFEFQFSFATNANPFTGPDPTPDGTAIPAEPAPSLSDAVKQYGLRLEARKAPIEMLIVTHLERTPTEN